MAGDIGIGRIIEGEAFRDAIHVAVAPVVSDEKLWPGQRVGLAEGSNDKVSALGAAIGVVDPFLKDAVYPGTRFYLFLLPGSITSLRHEWTHPAFEATPLKPDVAASKQWIVVFADSLGGDDDGPMTFDRLMEGADRYVAYSDYLVQHGSQSWGDLPYEMVEQFWRHYEVVRGKKVEDPAAIFFSCSC